jgi:hypothetical protein
VWLVSVFFEAVPVTAVRLNAVRLTAVRLKAVTPAVVLLTAAPLMAFLATFGPAVPAVAGPMRSAAADASVSIGNAIYVPGVNPGPFGVRQTATVDLLSGPVRYAPVTITMPALLGASGVTVKYATDNATGSCTPAVLDAVWSCTNLGTHTTITISYLPGGLDLLTQTIAHGLYSVTVAIPGFGYSATGTMTVEPHADLRVGPLFVLNSSPGTFFLYAGVSNGGPSPSRSTTVTVGGLRGQPAGPLPPGCTWSNATTLTCQIGTLSSPVYTNGVQGLPQSVQLKLPVPADFASLRLTARVAGMYVDLNTANNSGSVGPGSGGGGNGGAGGGSGRGTGGPPVSGTAVPTVDPGAAVSPGAEPSSSTDPGTGDASALTDSHAGLSVATAAGIAMLAAAAVIVLAQRRRGRGRAGRRATEPKQSGGGGAT